MSSAERILKQGHNNSFSQLTKAKPLSKYISIFLLPVSQHVNKKGRRREEKEHLDFISLMHSNLH
jgi:hypothetical protein